jgi:hypothetical protein
VSLNNTHLLCFFRSKPGLFQNPVECHSEAFFAEAILVEQAKLIIGRLLRYDT